MDAEEFASEMNGLLSGCKCRLWKPLRKRMILLTGAIHRIRSEILCTELGVLDNKDFNCGDMIDVSFVEKLAE